MVQRGAEGTRSAFAAEPEETSGRRSSGSSAPATTNSLFISASIPNGAPQQLEGTRERKRPAWF
jgi:hypothetical protein